MIIIMYAFFYLVFALCILAAFLIFLFLSYRAFVQFRIRSKSRITGEKGIEELKEVAIGGTKQWIYIRGKNRDNPVLLLSQDGYMPMIFRARDFSHSNGLEEFFTVVTWDKRGEGKSYLKEVNATFLDNSRYCEDILELTLYLKKYLKKEKIYLAGHSGGSESGIMAASRYGKHFYAYIGIGQVTNNEQNALGTYRTFLDMAKKEQNRETLDTLKTLGPPPYKRPEQMFTFFNLVYEHNLLYYDKDMSRNSKKRFLKNLLFSPEYTAGDVLKFLKDPMRIVKLKLAPETFFNKDFRAQFAQTAIPFYFIQGRFDFSTTGEELEKCTAALEKEGKAHIIYFERSGHYPCYEEPERFSLVMKSILEGRMQVR